MGEQTDRAKGRIKQAAGDLSGDEGLRDEGRDDERAGEAKGLLNDLKEKADGAVDAIKGRVDGLRDKS
jgi:uncharacterized protein YjbJ (UPF0337 family)